MTLTKYARSVAEDFPFHAVNVDRLTREIEDSNISVDLDHIIIVGSECDFWFDDPLVGEDESRLNEIVAQHNGQPIFSQNLDLRGNPVIATSVYGYVAEKTRFKGFRYIAPAGELSFFDEAITSQIFIQGGKSSISNATDGDYAEFSIIDKDDVLGLFSAYGLTVGIDVLELDKYVQTYYPDPGTAKGVEHKVDAAGQVMPGLYLRVIYNSTGEADVTLRITYLWYES